MRISKFLSIVGLITCFSLLYVYQQTEIFRLAYVGQKRQVFYQDMLDKNNILRYNIKRNASLVRIGSKISGSSDYEMPASYRLVRLTSPSQGIKPKEKPENRQTLAYRIFGIKRQAEAKTVTPSVSFRGYTE